MTEEKQFPQGIIFKTPRENAPEFIKGHLSFKTEEFIQYLQEKNNNGWVNIDIKKSKAGKLYLDLNDWKPEQKKDDTNVEQVPF